MLMNCENNMDEVNVSFDRFLTKFMRKNATKIHKNVQYIN